MYKMCHYICLFPLFLFFQRYNAIYRRLRSHIIKKVERIVGPTIIQLLIYRSFPHSSPKISSRLSVTDATAPLRLRNRCPPHCLQFLCALLVTDWGHVKLAMTIIKGSEEGQSSKRSMVVGGRGKHALVGAGPSL
jgi:hypothetical protein